MAKFNNTKSLKINENITNIGGGIIDEKIELIKTDIQRHNRVRKSDIDHLHNCIREEGICGSVQGIFLLQSCGKLLPNVDPKIRTKLAFSIWHTLRNIKCPLTLKHYSAFLSSLADNKHTVSVTDLLSQIYKDGLTLDANCCMSLLRCVCEVGDVKQAMEIKKIMLDSGIEITQQVLDYIILAHGRNRDMKTVESLIDSVESSSTLTVVLKVSAEAGHTDMFISYLNKAQILSEEQRLDISVSLATGNLTQFIPLVLNVERWSKEGIKQANNTSVQLVHSGHAEAGMIVLKTLAKDVVDGDTTYFSFFFEELLKSNTDVSTVINICNDLSEYNPRSLLKATECALTLQKQDVSIRLLKEMQEQGHPIRPHYFWPLFINASKRQKKTGILNILSVMVEMNVRPDFDTLKDYVFSQWKFQNMVDVVKDLRDQGLSLTEVMTPALHYLLSKDRIQEAVQLCSFYKCKLDWNLLLNTLAQCFIATGNVAATVALLKFADNSAPDTLVHNIVSRRKNPVQPQQLELLLKVLKAEGYTTVFSEGRDLAVLSPPNEHQYIPQSRNMNLEELECHLLELKAKQLNTRGVLRKLFQIHCGLGNLQRAAEIKKELDEGGFVFSSGMLASLFQLNVAAEQIHEAEACLKELQENHSNFKLDSYKIIDFAAALVNKKQYSKALTILENHKSEGRNEMDKNCWRLLNDVAVVEGVPQAKKVLTVLLTNNYTKVSGELLSPLINAHLQRNDLNGAVEEFENCVKIYNKTAMLYDLLRILCKHAEHNLLEKVLDISRKLHGASNVNVMLVMAMAEENLTSELINVVANPGFSLNIKKLVAKCSHFVDEHKALALENIKTSLLNVPTVNVEPFCELILQLCIKQENCDAASKLWTDMQELNITPTKKFSDNLKALMNRHKKTGILKASSL